MSENERIEFKESWRDEHLRHICAFANTQGGKLVAGIRDDGTVVGVKDGKQLMEDIPNKAVHLLGITVGSAIQVRKGKTILTISVLPSSVPISFHGHYFIRSGSTTQELHGHELRQFVLRKENISWDEITIPQAKLADIDSAAVGRFVRKAVDENRLPPIRD
jgi:ATP-dependent DNA helicase RecG